MPNKELTYYLMFSESEVLRLLDSDDEQLAFIIRATIEYYLTGNKEEILNRCENFWQRSCIKSYLDSQELRRKKYDEKCAKNSQNANKRWANSRNDEMLQKQIALMDPENKEVIELYAKEIGIPQDSIIAAIQKAIKEYSSEWIKDAILESVKANVRNWKYIEGILSRWKSWGGKQDPKRYIDNSDHTSIYASLYQH